MVKIHSNLFVFFRNHLLRRTISSARKDEETQKVQLKNRTFKHQIRFQRQTCTCTGQSVRTEQETISSNVGQSLKAEI